MTGTGRLDAIVNNAGGQFAQHSIDISDKGWRAVVDTNLNGTWTMMQRAARRWRSDGRSGSIVNIVIPYVRGMFGLAHAVAARSGVAFVSRTLAVEWAPLNVRVNCIVPGGIATAGLEVYDDAVVAEMAGANALGRMGQVQDVAEAVVYLAGPSGDYITGETLTVDGGHQLFGELWQAGRPEGWEEDDD